MTTPRETASGAAAAPISAVEQRLAELGITLPEVAAPVAAYVPAVISGNHVYTSGQLPFIDGKLEATGKVAAGNEGTSDEPTVSPEDAKAYAAVCAVNALAAVKSVIGDLDRITRDRQGGGLRLLGSLLHRPAGRHQRRLRTPRPGPRRRGPARPFRRRRFSPAARLPRRSRTDRGIQLRPGRFLCPS